MLPPHWKCTVAYQELADDLWDGEGQLCDIFHCGGIGSCRPIDPVYCNHVHLACVQYGTDKSFNPGRFGTQSPVESSETRMLGVFQNRACADMLFTGAGASHVSEEAAIQLLKVSSGARQPHLAFLCSGGITLSRMGWFRREPDIFLNEITFTGPRLRSQSCCGASVSHHRAHLE